jgi:multicomponent K+:H+ antiporter subunit E
MKRWLPAPLLSAALFVWWLLLQQSVAPAHLLLGALLAVLIPKWIGPLRPPTGPVRRPLRLARLIALVGVEVVASAWQVGMGVLRAHKRAPRGAFVTVPLELRSAHALAALAVITAVIPGTIWTELAADRSTLRLHVFDLEGSEAEFISDFKRRYELPLKEIFE